MERFPGRLSLPDGISVAAKLTLAEGRLTLEVEDTRVGEWPLEELTFTRQGETFQFEASDGERFAFTTVWDDELAVGLAPPSPLAASLIHGVRRGARVTEDPWLRTAA